MVSGSEDLSLTLTRVDADLLIPSRGVPTENGSCVFRGGTIVWVGPQASAPPISKGIPPIHVPALLARLWDCHTHFYGNRRIGIDALYEVGSALAGARTASDLNATLMAGLNSVRELEG